MNILKYYNTVRYLKPRQLYHQVLHQFRPLALKINVYGKFHGRRGNELKCQPWLPAPGSLVAENRFKFLNMESVFTGNWNIPDHGKLWNYNLNYMDFLLQENLPVEEGVKWILEFISGLQYNISGSEPYTISVRCMNWVKFISANREKIPSRQLAEIDSSLYAQFHVLSENPEYHLMGNHLLMNGVSLLSGAFYFNDRNFFDLSYKILETELEEQILEDGGHFELSPMYHQLILLNLLDCFNILINNPRTFIDQEKLAAMMKQKASLMLGWLGNITLPGGEIPLLNDSAYGITPVTGMLAEYAKNLFVSPVIVPLSDSGYRRFDYDNYVCIADVGTIGPDYIPGHGHADTFNFVLSLGSKQVIVDTGISTYEKNSARQEERETAAHNTVTVDGKNSSDVWGGFRVGKRANIKIVADTQSELVAEHDGYRSSGTIHRRHFIFNNDGFIVSDSLSGDKAGIVHLHFHPDVKVELKENKILLDCCTIMMSGITECRIMNYNWHPEFNKNVNSRKFEGVFRGSCEMKLNVG